MPNTQGEQIPVKTAEQAIDRASQFLGRHNYLVARPVSARREGDQWQVAIDVSVIGPKQIIRLAVDSESGAITEFAAEGAE